jgi:hypothetical protein
MGLAASEASAGCKIISGTKVCAAWITGSEICQVGLDSNQIPGFDAGATAQCIVRGVGTPEEGGTFTCNDSTLTGAQTCEGSTDTVTLAGASSSNNGGNGWHGTNPARQGPKCNHDKFDPNKNPSCVTGTPDLGGGTLESPTVPLVCDKKGICTATAEVGVPDGGQCSNGQDLVDFTADEFIGIVVFDGSEGTTLLFQHCTLDQGGHNYTCTDITNNVDEGTCGFGD